MTKVWTMQKISASLGDLPRVFAKRPANKKVELKMRKMKKNKTKKNKKDENEK